MKRICWAKEISSKMVIRGYVSVALLLHCLSWGCFADFHYDKQSKWGDHYLKCGGKRQSPIDISSADLFSPVPFEFRHYDVLLNVSLENNGHSLNVNLHPNGKAPFMTGGGLENNYELAGFHFHWGDMDSKGSEHLLGGCAFPAEMHLVHFKRKYGSVKEALEHDDGLAVLGFWLIPDDTRKKHIEEDKFLNETEDALRSSPSEETSSSVEDVFSAITPSTENLDGRHITIDLSKFLANTRHFYRYSGSLTTPPCTENVEWTVFEDPLPVPPTFLQALRELIDEKGESMNNNFRIPKPLKRRKILFSGTSPRLHPTCPHLRTLLDQCHGSPSLALLGNDPADICTDGEDTSPVDLHLAAAEPSLSSMLTWKRVGECDSLRVTREGGALKAVFRSSEPQWILSGGNLKDTYSLSHLLLRWGSEHHLGGLAFPLEVQLFHQGLKEDDVVIVSKFYQEPTDFFEQYDPYNNDDVRNNAELQDIIDDAKNLDVSMENYTLGIRAPNIKKLVGDASSYYEYSGTLPGFPCRESATWMVLRRAGTVSASQIQELHNILDEDGNQITANNRPLKPIGQRKLYLRVSNPELVHEYNVLLRNKRSVESNDASRKEIPFFTLLVLLMLKFNLN